MIYVAWTLVTAAVIALVHVMITMSRAGVPAETRFYGHPRGLATLFFTEMWERFSYYGMRAILMLFMTTAVAEGGLGFTAEKAGPIYAMYTALVYLATVPGGWIADNFLGQRRSVFFGGIVIMIGHVLLAFHGMPAFYSGLGCVVVGTGLLKPNISVIVGQLYGPEDRRRDAGFSIFYMGINLGAFSAPLVCGTLLAQGGWFKQRLESWGIDPASSWHWGFGAAAVGMFLGLVQYLWTGRHLGEAGLRPSAPIDAAGAARNRRILVGGLVIALLAAAGVAAVGLAAPERLTKDNVNLVFRVLLFGTVIAFFGGLFLRGDWTRAERARLVMIFVLFCSSAVFWAIFEQAGSTLTLFAENSTRNSLFGASFGSSTWQSVNGLLIVLLAPVLAWLWIALGRRDPSSTTKFAVGLLFAGLGFCVLVFGARFAQDGTRVSPLWLFSVYLLHTIGELCLSPVGLSSMTKLAPARMVSLVMGVWFLSLSVGNYLGGTVSGYYEKLELPTLLTLVAASGIATSILMFLLVRPIQRMMARNPEPAGAPAAH